jgi:type II secretory pathway pseudopilin PulG
VTNESGRARAVALLEVVLALAVFFGVAVAILGGLSMCMRSAREVRHEAQAADLAITILSEVQMGLTQIADAGPSPFEDPHTDWTWQTVATPVPTTIDGTELTRIEIIVRNSVNGYAYRLYQLLPGSEEETATGTTAMAAESGEAP